MATLFPATLVLAMALAGPSVAADKCTEDDCSLRIGAAPNEPRCPCPGVGCPDGGWFYDKSLLDNPEVAYCFEKARKAADKKRAACRKAGQCELETAKEAPLKPLPSSADKECPCPGPGCPDGGWFGSDDILKDPVVQRCYEKSVAQEKAAAKRKEANERRLKKARSAVPKDETSL